MTTSQTPTPTPTVDPRRGHTSASNALADSLCPGRHLAQAGLPDDRSSPEYAEFGSKVHRALANSSDVAFMASLTLEERETFDACREIEKRLVAQYFGENHPPMKVFREQRYWVRIKNPGGQTLEHSGQPDAVFRAGTKALILEYKTLFGEVPGSPKNLQLRDQAVLAVGNLLTVDEVAVAVVQPAVSVQPVPCLYSAEDLRRAAKEMYDRVIASNTAKQPRTAGETQCKFCRAKSLCVEYQKWAAQITPPAMLTVLDIPMVAWTPEQRATAAAALAPAQKFLDDLKDFLKEGLAKDPAFCPGWTLQPGAKREAISDPQKCFERFVALGGKIEQFMPCVNVKKGELKEALHVVTDKKGKALAAAMEALTQGIVEVKRTEPSLKRAEAEEKP